MLACPKIADIKNKTVLVRVDYNVPLKTIVNAKTGKKFFKVADDARIRSSLETINFLLDHGAKVILISHLGRPDGKFNADFSLAPVAKYLKNVLDLPAFFVDDCVGQKVEESSKKLESGQILILENLRFYSAEEKGDRAFAREIIKATGAELYINEAFSACHRAHASVVALAKLLPAFAGFSLRNEVSKFEEILGQKKSPVVVVMGGAKISEKIATLKNLAALADVVLTGGGIANALLKAGGIETHQSYLGASATDSEAIAKTLQISGEILKAHNTERFLVENDGRGRKNLPLPKIVLPIDVLAAKNKAVSSAAAVQHLQLVTDVADTDNDLALQYLDIGPETIKLYRYILSQAKTIIWNGPMGVFENPLFARGSRELARAAAAAKRRGAKTLVGGGESNSIINALGLAGRFTHVSTAGGAALEYLSGKKLPGVEVLER